MTNEKSGTGVVRTDIENNHDLEEAVIEATNLAIDNAGGPWEEAPEGETSITVSIVHRGD